MKTINVIVNNSVRIFEQNYTLADGGNILINDLSANGVQVNLIGLAQKLNDPNMHDFIKGDVKVYKLTLITNHKSLFFKTLNYVYAIVKLLAICLKKGYFYVYLPSNVSIIILFFLRLFRKNYGLYVRGAIKHSRLNGKVRHYNFINLFYQNSIRKASFVLVTGKYLFEETLKLNPKTEQVIPMISIKSEDLFLRYKFDRADRLLFVGRIDKEKGVEDIIDAAQILLEKGNDFIIYLAGGVEEEYFEFLKMKISEKNLSTKVVFLGKINDLGELKKLYLDNDIFIFPSHHEGFPRVLYEAMTFGLPIIATDLETYSGTMNDGENCTLIPVADANALASAIFNLITSKEKRILYSNNSLKYMQVFFKNNVSKSHAIQVISNFEFIS